MLNNASLTKRMFLLCKNILIKAFTHNKDILLSMPDSVLESSSQSQYRICLKVQEDPVWKI